MPVKTAIQTDLNPSLRTILTQIVDAVNHQAVNIITTEPTISTLRQGESVLYYDGTDLWTYTNRQNNLYKLQWTQA